MPFVREAEIDPSCLHGRKVAIIGFGNQGRAQALNLRDSGIDVRIGLRDGSASRAEVEAAGLPIVTPEAAARDADLVMLLTPDEQIPEIYAAIASSLRPGTSLGFSHGLVVHYRLITPRPDIPVIMIAPKGPGTALRSLYTEGRGMVGLVAVKQDPQGDAWPLALAYGAAIGCARAGLLRSTFEEECIADLFNESAVVWGAVPAILEAGFATLTDAGVQPELAYLECVSELKLLADLIEASGIAGMREAISNTAEFGAMEGGPRIVDEHVRTEMRAVLQGLRRDDGFARRLIAERFSGYRQLNAARETATTSAIESARRSLKRSTD